MTANRLHECRECGAVSGHIPPELWALIDEARETREAFRRGEASMHDSSTATVKAREALHGWMMALVHTPAA
jgi:hypothetical protein